MSNFRFVFVLLGLAMLAAVPLAAKRASLGWAPVEDLAKFGFAKKTYPSKVPNSRWHIFRHPSGTVAHVTILRGRTTEIQVDAMVDRTGATDEEVKVNILLPTAPFTVLGDKVWSPVADFYLAQIMNGCHSVEKVVAPGIKCNAMCLANFDTSVSCEAVPKGR